MSTTNNPHGGAEFTEFTLDDAQASTQPPPQFFHGTSWARYLDPKANNRPYLVNSESGKTLWGGFDLPPHIAVIHEDLDDDPVFFNVLNGEASFDQPTPVYARDNGGEASFDVPADDEPVVVVHTASFHASSSTGFGLDNGTTTQAYFMDYSARQAPPSAGPSVAPATSRSAFADFKMNQLHRREGFVKVSSQHRVDHRHQSSFQSIQSASTMEKMYQARSQSPIPGDTGSHAPTPEANGNNNNHGSTQRMDTVVLNSVPGFVGANTKIFVDHVEVLRSATGAKMVFSHRRNDIKHATSSLHISGSVEQMEIARLGIAAALSFNRSAHTDFSQFDRPDIECLQIPAPRVGFIMGQKNTNLMKLEKDTGTFTFFNQKVVNQNNEKALYIIGGHLGRREAANQVRRMLGTKSYRGHGGSFQSQAKGESEHHRGRKRTPSPRGRRSGNRYRNEGNEERDHRYRLDRRNNRRKRSRSRSPRYRSRGRDRGRAGSW
jgi:hypothetical protein